MMAAGCGVTPIMSMSRWLLAHRPNVHLQVIFNARNPQQVIFATEWQRLTEHYPSQLTLTLVAEFDAETGFLAGRLTPELLKQAVPDLAQRMVMTCGRTLPHRSPMLASPQHVFTKNSSRLVLNHWKRTVSS